MTSIAKETIESRSALAVYQQKMREFHEKMEIQNLTPADEADRVTAMERIATLEERIARNEAVERRVAELAPEFEAKMASQERLEFGFGSIKASKVPARAIASSTTCFSSNQAAYDCGRWIQATLLGDHAATKYCYDRGLVQSAMVGGNDLRGGALVPVELENAIIELRESFGVIRQNSQVISMGSDQMLIPRMSAELTSFYISENAAITPSTMTLNQVTLTSRKLATLTTISSELNEDSVISVAEMLARSVAQTFAVQEDAAGFLGAGGVAHGGILGLDASLLAGSVVTATGRATFGVLTFADFENCIGRAKLWAGSRPKWFISNAGYCSSMLRLQNAAGGNNRQDLAAGVPPSFLGYPVVITQTLPSALTGTTGTLALFFGDLQQGVYFGSRRGVTLALDSSRYFEQDALAVRATERFDIVVHDRGDAVNAGGIIELVFG